MTFRHIISQAILRSRHISSSKELEDLLDQTAKNIARAVEAKEQLLTEKEVAQR